MTHILGIDIAKATFDVHLVSATERYSGHFDNDAVGFGRLQRWLEKRHVKPSYLHACMEATGRYGVALATFLFEQGYKVSIVNPKATYHHAKGSLLRNKTDKLDARNIADFCAAKKPRAWQPPEQAQVILQALTRRVAALQEDRTREKNRLKSGDQPAVIDKSIKAAIAFFDAQIADLEQQIQQHIDDHSDSLGKQRDLLKSIQGIGDKTAAIMLSELPDVSCFKTAKQVTAYAGLTPEQLQSGKSHKNGSLIKLGSKRLRTALYFPAIVGMRHNPILRRLAERMAADGKRKMTIVAALMRKLLRLVYGVLKTQTPFDPDYLVNVQGAA